MLKVRSPRPSARYYGEVNMAVTFSGTAAFGFRFVSVPWRNGSDAINGVSK